MKRLVFMFVIITALPFYVSADPVIDPASIKDENVYYKDLAQCKALAENNSKGKGDVARDSIVGAGVGAGTGALIGAISGKKTAKKAGYGAVIGGVGGGARSAYQSNEEYDRIFKNCMWGRGYTVLN